MTMGNETMRQRNVTLDWFKLVLAFLVVTIHLPFTGSLFGWEVSHGIARVAVPCFFLINGYYLEPRIGDPACVRKYILHLLLIYAVWLVVYLPFIYGSPWSELRNIPRLILLGYRHLWYILGLVYGTAALFVLRKLKLNDLLLLAISIGVVAAAYVSANIFHFLPRTSFFGLVAFVFIGSLIRKYDVVGRIRINGWVIAVFALGVVGLLGDSFAAREYYGTNLELSLSLLVVCPLLFVFVMRGSVSGPSDGYVGELSAAVYFLHPLVISGAVVSGLPNGVLYGSVVFVTLVLGAGVIALNKRIRIFL